MLGGSCWSTRNKTSFGSSGFSKKMSNVVNVLGIHHFQTSIADVRA